MKLKIFVLYRKQETPEAFEKRVNEWLGSAGDVILSQVQEDLNSSNITFSFLYGETNNVEQELCVIGYPTGIEATEGAVNAALDYLAENNQIAKYINLVTTSKSSRWLIAFIAESSRSRTSDTVGTESIEKGHEDAGQDAKSKPRRQRKSKSAD